MQQFHLKWKANFKKKPQVSTFFFLQKCSFKNAICLECFLKRGFHIYHKVLYQMQCKLTQARTPIKNLTREKQIPKPVIHA